ncbi:MAG: hypothetical protein ACLQBA_24815 [Candidatus Binataceae bacterium]
MPKDLRAALSHALLCLFYITSNRTHVLYAGFTNNLIKALRAGPSARLALLAGSG